MWGPKACRWVEARFVVVIQSRPCTRGRPGRPARRPIIKNGPACPDPLWGLARAAEFLRTSFSLDFCQRSDRDPRGADAQPEEHLLRDSPWEADGGQRGVG